jgi:hypothetical protein
VPEPARNLFAAWESFYVIIGSSAAALTGLQFVVIALVAESDRRGGVNEIAAFGTPTVVHFCSALLLSAILTAPWPSSASASHAVTIAGLAGLFYTAVVIRRARAQTGYKPVFEDWLWHTVLPAAAYTAILLGGLTLADENGPVPFFVGGAALLLVFIGIHNAWDTVTWIALDALTSKPAPPATPAAAAAPPQNANRADG